MYALKSIISTFMCLLILLTMTKCSVEEQAPPPKNRSELDKYLQAISSQKKISAASLAVMKDDSVVGQYHFNDGKLITESVQPNTVYQIASATKIFTGALAMILSEEGVISLEDSVGNFLKDIPASWRNIKLKNLLSHTSGLPRLLNPDTGEMLGKDAATSLEKAMDFEVRTKAGDEWSYNQLGFYLIQKVFVKETGLEWEELLKKYIFSPLEMTSTTYQTNDNSVKSFSLLSSAEPEAFSYDYQVKPAGGIYTSSKDLTKFMKGIHSNQLMKEKKKDMMWSKFTLNDESKAEYGLGWDMSKLNGKQTVGHTGGRKVAITHFTKSKITVILLTNTYGSDPINFVGPIEAVF